MLFTSTVFIFLFLPLTILIYYLLLRKNRFLQNVFLTIASLLFYTFGEPRFVSIMVLSIFMNWVFALILKRYKNYPVISKTTLSISVFINVAILFIFKYLVFTIETINSIFTASLFIPSFVLPIGISFFTFQAISYVIDVYRGDGEAQNNPINVALYISFFPQLIAGPIVRYNTISKQILSRTTTIDSFSSGCIRFMVGFSKKVLLANTLGLIADRIFSTNLSQITSSLAWLGIISYAFQIFFDFSAYSDMAIGLGKIFGFNFSENFNYPYISKSISEFWRRWHISLGTWFRDYVYFPLGGSRVKKQGRLILNLLIVWSLTGVWHGANITFLVWGLMYFVLISIEKINFINKKIKKHKILSRIYTIFFILIGWTIFRSPNISFAAEYIKKLFFISDTHFSEMFYVYLKEYYIFYFAAILLSTPIFRFINNKYTNILLGASQNILISLLFLVSIIYLVNNSYNPFIYFNF